MIPTIVTLVKIAKALGKRASFFIEEDNTDRILYIKKEKRRRFYSDESACLLEHIAGELENCELQAVIHTAKPGGKSGDTLNSHIGEEILHCLKGEIEVFTDDKTYRLQVGDTLHFKSDIPHRWKNIHKSESQVLLIHAGASKILK